MTLVARIAFLILVASTFAAFFVAQRLKSEPPVISVGRLTSDISPNGDGKRDGSNRVRVSLRAEGRSAIVPKTMTVDTSAPRSAVCIGFRCGDPRKRMGNIISQGDRKVRIYIRGVSQRHTTLFRVLRTDDGEPREVTRMTLPAGKNRLIWDPRVDGKPLALGTYIVQSEVRDTAGNVGVTPAVLEVGAEIPGRPGLTVRGIAGQPPLRPVTAGGRVEFRVDARGASYRWRVRRVGEPAIRKRGEATDSRLA